MNSSEVPADNGLKNHIEIIEIMDNTDPQPQAPAVRVEITSTGRGEYAAFVLDPEGREIDRTLGSHSGVLEWVGEHYSGVPVHWVPTLEAGKGDK